MNNLVDFVYVRRVCYFSFLVMCSHFVLNLTSRDERHNELLLFYGILRRFIYIKVFSFGNFRHDVLFFGTLLFSQRREREEHEEAYEM